MDNIISTRRPSIGAMNTCMIEDVTSVLALEKKEHAYGVVVQHSDKHLERSWKYLGQ